MTLSQHKDLYKFFRRKYGRYFALPPVHSIDGKITFYPGSRIDEHILEIVLDNGHFIICHEMSVEEYETRQKIGLEIEKYVGDDTVRIREAILKPNPGFIFSFWPPWSYRGLDKYMKSIIYK